MIALKTPKSAERVSIIEYTPAPTLSAPRVTSGESARKVFPSIPPCEIPK